MDQFSFPIQNSILRRLPEYEIAHLGSLERVPLPLRLSLEVADAPIEYVYFIEDGMASVVSTIGPSGTTEIGLVGSEGMTGVGLAYGDMQGPFDTFMQVGGSGLRCPTSAFRELYEVSPTLRQSIGLYARAFSIQTAMTAVVNGRYKLQQRLARWLLMVSDRVGPVVNLTHEFLAVMLAVRRSGVTLAIQEMEGNRAIRATRGAIHIVDRDLLLAMAGDAYGLPEREYNRLLGDPVSQSPPTKA